MLPNELEINTTEISPSVTLAGQFVSWTNQTLNIGENTYEILVKVKIGSIIEDKIYGNKASVESAAYPKTEANTTYHKAMPSSIAIEKSAVVTDKKGVQISIDIGI